MEVNGIEESFLLGNWDVALNESKRVLLMKEDMSVSTATRLDILPIYLQSIFESATTKEINSAFTILQSFPQLPSKAALQWSKMLLSMGHKEEALKVLTLVLQDEDNKEISLDKSPHHIYYDAIKILIMVYQLPNDTLETIEKRIIGDSNLNTNDQQRLMESIRAVVASSKEDLNLNQQSIESAVNSINNGTDAQGGQTKVNIKQSVPSTSQNTSTDLSKFEQLLISPNIYYIGVGAAAVAITLGAVHYKYNKNARNSLWNVITSIKQFFEQ